MRATQLRWRAAVTLPLVLVAIGCSRNPTAPSPIGVVAPNVGPAATLAAGSSVTSVFLHGIGTNANPAALMLDALAPTATTEKYKDSPSVKFAGGNAWVAVGTWTASPTLTVGSLTSLGDLQLWLGLKNSDDVGTNFDVRAEVYKNGALVASAESDCISGITRNASLAKAVGVAFAAFEPVKFDGVTDVLSLKLLTRIGTNAAGGSCGGHGSASGLRVYFDATSRAAMFDAGFADETATVDVTVVEEKTNSPIRGATVTLQYGGKVPKDKLPPGGSSGTTDGHGFVEFFGQPVGIPVVIVAVVNDGSGRVGAAKSAGFAAGRNSVLVTVPLLSGGSLSGVVTDASTGGPLAGVEINLNQLGTGTSIPGGRTGADGSYAVSGLQQGNYDVTFVLSGYQGYRAYSVPIVPGSNTVQDAQLTVLPPPPIATVNVTVFDASGSPVGGATVTITYADGSPSAIAQTDGEGFVQFANQPAGVGATISVNGPDGSSQTLPVPAGFLAGANSFSISM